MDEPITRREEYYAGIAEALRNGGGGGGSVEPVIVMINNHTADKTNGEILELLNAGVPVYIRYDYSSSVVVEMQVTIRFEGDGSTGLLAMCVNPADDTLDVAYTTGGLDDDGWAIQEYTITRVF